MTRRKKLALVLVLLLALVALSQAPFIYRRYQLGQLQTTIESLNAARVAPAEDGYADHRGVIHAHSFLGGHSTGSFADIVAGARANNLHFVVMTEHPAPYVNTAEITLRGTHEGTLFVGGREISAAGSDRLLLVGGDLGAGDYATPPASTAEAIAQARSARQLVFIAYPEQFASWDAAGGADGIEIYNLYTNARRINRPLMFFDGLWSLGSYHALLFARFHERPAENLRRWDELTSATNRRLVAIAGNDAHANVGLRLAEARGRALWQLLLDPYEVMFQLVRTHALIESRQPLSEETLLAALARGHCYVAFDVLGDATGFRFSATNGSERRIMGDEIGLTEGTRLIVTTPIPARIRLFRDGQAAGEASETRQAEFTVTERGVYRVEAYLDQLPAFVREQPWIISNPIYVR